MAGIVVDVPYRCVRITYDPTKFSMATAELTHADGTAGTIKITGVAVDEIEKGKVYIISEIKNS